MLTTGRYTQRQSRFLRYIDTRPNGDALRKCILEGPYKLITITILVVPATDDSPEVPERTAVETLLNMSPEKKEHYQSEKEAIHLLLTGIGDEIYLTVDAYVKTNLFWEFGKFTSHDGESTELYYSKFYNMMNEMEVNEIRAERIATNANPLALVVVAQQYPDPYYQAPKSHKSHAPSSKQSSSTRSNASTKYKGKEIVKPITPPSESAFEEDNDPEQTQRDKDMQKNLALIAKYFKKIYKPTNNNLITSLKSINKNVDTSPRYKNDNQTMQFGNKRTMTVAGARETVGSQECRKSKRAKDYTNDKKKMLMCKQAEKVEEVDSNVIPDSLDLCNNDIQTDQNAEDCDDERTDQNAEECDDERVALANLIANLTLDTKENKKILKQLKKANASLNQELKECKSNLEESNTTRDSCLIALQNKQTELGTYKTLNDLVKEIHDELVKQSFLTKSRYEGLVKEKTKVITDLKLKEEKYLDKLFAMEKQLKFLNEIFYKRNQSIQTIHMLAPKGSTFNGRPTFANPMYLKKAQSEKPCLYEIPYDTSDLANRFIPDRKETLTLEKESRSKLNKDLVKPYDYTKQNSLYEIFKPAS
ncbi:hypothetical protein Tco_0688748 [Tanacetum coccineum]